ncbi:MAG: tRNA-dihydrouridine synthase [Candidatus Pacebacteria bacterium]|nr:tRNA-dihydrouridine synthase [Candidatus Paceibacterota bacterium]
MSNIWKTLPKPFSVLAPMDDVTDLVFREIVCETSKPDLFFTEFANCEALCSEGKKFQESRLRLTNLQHPIIAQIWGVEPEHFKTVAQHIRSLGFDGIDINMGCPIRVVVKNGACAGLIRDRKRAHEIILATQEGAGYLPVSVKTRIGLNTIITEDWIGFLLEHHLAAITVHGRTAKEQSKVPNHWDEIGKAVQLRDRVAPNTIIVGNGDVKTWEEALQITKVHGVDGVMIGRGIFENMWVFERDQQRTHEPREIIDLLKKHVALFDHTWGTTKKFDVMKKFFKIYVNGFAGAKEMRADLMESKTSDDVLQKLQAFPQNPTGI